MLEQALFETLQKAAYNSLPSSLRRLQPQPTHQLKTLHLRIKKELAWDQKHSIRIHEQGSVKTKDGYLLVRKYEFHLQSDVINGVKRLNASIKILDSKPCQQPFKALELTDVN